MKGVICLQLCDVAIDRSDGIERKCNNGLTVVLDQYVLDSDDLDEFQSIKDRGIQLSNLYCGGRWVKGGALAQLI